METSQNVEMLAEALAEAQAELAPVQFDSFNKYYSSRYASLSAVIAEVKRILPSHGLSIVQTPTSYYEDGVYYAGVETMVIHSSGQWIKGVVTLPVVPSESLVEFTRRFNKDGEAYFTSPNILQEVGKVITYLRRYGIVSILMLSAEEDLDGNEPVQQVQPQTKKSEPIKEVVSEKKKSVPERPYSPEALKEALKATAENPKVSPASDKGRSIVAAVLSQFTDEDDTERHAIQKFLFDTESIKDANPRMVAAVLRWLNPEYDSETKEYKVSEYVIDELENIIEIL